MPSHISPLKILLKVVLKQKKNCYQILEKIIELHFQLFLSSILSRGKMTAVDTLHRSYCGLHEMVVQHSFMSRRLGGQTEWAQLIGLWWLHLGKPVMVRPASVSAYDLMEAIIRSLGMKKSSVDVNWGHLWKNAILLSRHLNWKELEFVKLDVLTHWSGGCYGIR